MASQPARLLTTRDLALAAWVSLAVAVLMASASIAGLASGSALYGDDATTVAWFRGSDAANALVGLPALLGSLWLARRGSRIGLLLWPGALYYVAYAYALYVVGTPFNALFLVYVVLVAVSAYATIGIVASVDGAAVRQQVRARPARAAGAALIAVGLLATAGLTYPVIATLAGAVAFDPLLHAEWIVDYLFGTPVLLVGGALLWRRASLGFVVAPGLLFLSAENGVAFAVSGALGALVAAGAVDVAVVALHLAIATACLALLAVFLADPSLPCGDERRVGQRATVHRPGEPVAGGR